MSKHILPIVGAVGALAAVPWNAQAQIDPEPRQLLHLGFNQSLVNDGPGAAYAFYYWNMPGVPGTNETLRLAIAPVYVDGELGFRGLLGPNTDLGVGAFGGLFANSYDEVRQGNYFRNESFDGNGGGIRTSIYHLFNPAARIPLSGVLSGELNYYSFDESDDTAKAFVLPESQPFITMRTGLRWGGKEPIIGPRLAMEVSGWFELMYRPDSGAYGFSHDRVLNSTSERFLTRAQVNYTTPKHEHYIVLGLMSGAVLDPDRFSAYRIGGALPFTSEFPLYLPGYFYQELSAKNFGLTYGSYSIPLDAEKRWSITGVAAAAYVDYAPGLSQSGNWNRGAGGGLGYTAPSGRWRIIGGYGYGFDAMRSDGRGGQNIAMVFQYNFGGKKFASDRAFEELQSARVPIH